MLIFLDIDGVMVPAKGWKCPELLSDGFPAFGSRAVRTLQKLVSEGNTTIVLTTSHKSTFTFNQWKNIFKSREINVEKIERLPENISNLNRRDEIVNWFNLNNIMEDFIIIDDDKSLNDLPKDLKDYLVQTSSFIGLTEEHLEVVEHIRARKLIAS